MSQFAREKTLFYERQIDGFIQNINLIYIIRSEIISEISNNRHTTSGNCLNYQVILTKLFFKTSDHTWSLIWLCLKKTIWYLNVSFLFTFYLKKQIKAKWD